MPRRLSASLAVALALQISFTAAARAELTHLRPEVLQTYPHDPQAFTQGLLLHDGVLYESTGLYGQSSLRKVELDTGTVLRRIDLPSDFFGEGLALAAGKLVQLTWREDVAPTYDLASFTKNGEFKYSGEGWGLCFDGTQYIQSDGSHRLIFRDPTTFAITRQIAVTEQGQPITGLNELECVGEFVYANVWLTERIVEIAKLNGIIRSTIDASGLLSPTERAALPGAAVLNGIAHDPSNGTFLLTGKLWPKLFRVRFQTK